MIEIKRKDGEITSLLAKGKADDIISMLANNMLESSDLMELVEDAYLTAKQKQVDEDKSNKAFIMIHTTDYNIVISMFGDSNNIATTFAIFAGSHQDHYEIMRKAMTAYTYRQIEKHIKENEDEKY